MIQSEVENLRSQLTTARNEINKLRQQVRNLQHIHRKDIDAVKTVLQQYRCEGCRQLEVDEENKCNSNEPPPPASILALNVPPVLDNAVQFCPIGEICSVFPEKRAVPRQAIVGGRLRGVIKLNSDVFTNPEHSLQGLQEFSHLWIIYHFHKNTSHPKAKVAPPRLGGERVGVFSTRSPHRPCPIGLSLVEIQRIEGASISFFGTDMVNGTPVLDIKPYIPFYDSPIAVDSARTSTGSADTVDFYNCRQEPDGEESDYEMLGAGATGGTSAFGQVSNLSNHVAVPSSSSVNATVKVPNWVVANHRLNVRFNEHAEQQLQELQVQRHCIVDILETDPRSVYLRTKHGSQIFTFQLSEVTVTCKFDDRAGTVTVVQIRRTENVQDEEISEQG